MMSTVTMGKAFLIAAGGAATLLIGGATAASADHLPVADSVTLCHATASENNPYVSITIDDSGVLAAVFGANGHDSHDDDIIPAFGYIDQNNVLQHYDGKNLDDGGQAILDNGCVVPPTSTTEPPATTTPSESTTPSTTPGRTVPSGGVDTGGYGLDGNLNAPASFALLGGLVLGIGSAVIIRRRMFNR